MEEVYRAAVYRVEAHEPFELRVGQYSDALNSLFSTENCRSAAFLTAYNPRGVKTADTVNSKSQKQLDIQIALLELPTFTAIGLDPNPNSTWPGELSTFVLGVSKHDAVRLGVLFHQLAILWCPRSAVPELLFLETPKPAP